MKQTNLNRLKEVLGIHTYFGEEEKMAVYLQEVLTERGYDFEMDIVVDPRGSVHHNIYVTKGDAKLFPCFVSHIDTVHRINENMVVEEVIKDNAIVLTGIDSESKRPSGIGGDDKCGVYLCLEMLDTLDNVKVAFFGGEEHGMCGSKQMKVEFFDDVSYAIQYDSPQGNTMSMSLQGLDLFDKESKFGDIVSETLYEYGISEWCRHPYTDAFQVITKAQVSTLNLAAGYHRYHRPDEYVVIDEVQNSFNLGIKLVELLGNSIKYSIERKSIYG